MIKNPFKNKFEAQIFIITAHLSVNVLKRNSWRKRRKLLVNVKKKRWTKNVGYVSFFYICVPNLSAHYFYIPAKNGELISRVKKLGLHTRD